MNLTYLSSIRCLFRGLPAGLAAALVIAASFSLPGAEPAGSPTPAPAGPPSVAAPGLASQPATTDWVGDLITFSSKYQTIVPLMAGPNDPNITRLTAHVLQQTHYLRRQLDAAMSERFLHRYLEMLDPTRVHFLESDLKEFQRFVPQLTEMTLVKGETLVAREIFARFLQRVEQRVEYVAGLLRENQFDFTGEDRYQPNRKDAPHPADEAAARALWKQHLRFEYLTEKLNKKSPAEIAKTLSSRYKRLLKGWGELDSDDLLQVYLTSLAQAYDPHSDYMGKAQLDNFAISMNLSLFGIGALLRAEDDYCKIESLTPGGPALRSKKLKPGDRIVAVAQKDAEAVDVVGWKLNKIVELIRGPKGTEVTLTIIPADSSDSSQRRTLTLVRDEVKLEDQEAKARLYEVPDADGKTIRLGVIDLPSFYASFDVGSNKGKGKDKGTTRSTSADVSRLIKKLTDEKAAGIILDLRRNGGGSLEEAIRLTGLFIKEGPVVQVRDTDGEINVESDRDPEIAYNGPLIVLTSRSSASASEIVAAALQDYGRALVVGDNSTHGKGTVQTIYELGRFSGRFPTNVNPGALKTTIRKFYRANGASTQLKGVTPDIILPSVANYVEGGEAAQENALEWDTIKPALFEPLNRVQAHLDELRRRTEQRQTNDPEFANVREDIEIYRKFLAEKTVSLNEAARRQEKEGNDARNKARKADRRTRGATKDKVYEITLKNAEEPGLPAPGLKVAEADEAAAKTPPGHEAVKPGDLKGSDGDGSTLKKAAEKTDPEADPDEADEADAKAPVVDPWLDEARRILLDYVTLAAAPAPPGAAAPVAARN